MRSYTLPDGTKIEIEERDGGDLRKAPWPYYRIGGSGDWVRSPVRAYRLETFARLARDRAEFEMGVK
jgi:hypothetical protein